MAISLNNIQQSQLTSSNTNIIATPQEKNTVKDGSVSTQTKVLVGVGLAVLAAAGIYIATRGRGGVKSVNKPNTETTNESKEMTAKLFKKDGNKFSKGRAIMTDGSNYSGKITSILSDGKNVVLEYENGFLRKSTKFEGEKVLFNKDYTYDAKGHLSHVIANSDKSKPLFSAKYNNRDKIVNGKKASYWIDATGKLKSLKFKDKYCNKFFRYTSDGKLHSYTHDYCSKDGKLMHDLVILHPDEKTKRIVIEADGKSTLYDKKGNVVDSIHLDLTRGQKYIYYNNNYIFNKDFDQNGRTREYRFKGVHSKARGGLLKYNIIENGKVVPQKNLYLTLDDGRKYSLVKDGSKELSIILDDSQASLAKDSAEYKEVLNLANDWLQEFKTEYKKAMKLQNEVLIAKRQSEKIANSALKGKT